MRPSAEIIFMRESDPRLPPENYAMWDQEAYTTAQLVNGVEPQNIYPGVTQLFASKKQGWYAVVLDSTTNQFKRVAEREWETMPVYMEKITENAVSVAIKYPACAELAEKHLAALRNYITAGLFSSRLKVAHFAGLAVDPSYRGRGLANILVQKSLETLKAEGYTNIAVETTGNGSKSVVLGLNNKFRVVELAALEYIVAIPTAEETLFRIFNIIL